MRKFNGKGYAMKNIILILALVLASNLASAVCNTPISRSAFTANQKLTSARLNSEFNTVYERANELPGDCVTTNTLSGTKILDNTITNVKISSTAAISRSKLSAPNYAISANSETFTTSLTSFSDVTNLSVSITTTGGPVEIYLVGNGDVVSYIGAGSATSAAFGLIKVLRGATEIASFQVGSSHTGSTTTTYYTSPGFIRVFDTPAAGTYTYKVTAAVTNVAYGLPIYNCRLIAREL